MDHFNRNVYLKPIQQGTIDTVAQITETITRYPQEG